MINVDEHFEGNLKEAKKKDKKNHIIHHPPREGLQRSRPCACKGWEPPLSPQREQYPEVTLRWEGQRAWGLVKEEAKSREGSLGDQAGV